MSKHTPGPWKTCTASNGHCPCGLIWSIPADVVVAELGSEEGSPSHTGDEGAANAALIAAAPEMLAALRRLFKACGHMPIEATPESAEMMTAGLDAVRAIKKATGEDP